MRKKPALHLDLKPRLKSQANLGSQAKTGLRKRSFSNNKLERDSRSSQGIARQQVSRSQVSRSGDDQPLFALFVKGVGEREHPISRGSGLRNCADYGLSRSVFSFFARTWK